jgi:hypothetical protein
MIPSSITKTLSKNQSKSLAIRLCRVLSLIPQTSFFTWMSKEHQNKLIINHQQEQQ